MHKTDGFGAAAAEWILSLIGNRESAAATVGDLVETSSLSFITVARIVLTALLEQVLSSPARVGILAIAAFIGQFLALLPVAVVVAGSSYLLRDSGREPVWVAFPGVAILAIAFCLTQFFAGKWVVRLSRGCEISVCLALAVLNLLAALSSVYTVSISMAWWEIPFLIGAVTERRLSLRRA